MARALQNMMILMQLYVKPYRSANMRYRIITCIYVIARCYRDSIENVYMTKYNLYFYDQLVLGIKTWCIQKNNMVWR